METKSTTFCESIRQKLHENSSELAWLSKAKGNKALLYPNRMNKETTDALPLALLVSQLPTVEACN